MAIHIHPNNAHDHIRTRMELFYPALSGLHGLGLGANAPHAQHFGVSFITYVTPTGMLDIPHHMPERLAQAIQNSLSTSHLVPCCYQLAIVTQNDGKVRVDVNCCAV